MPNCVKCVTLVVELGAYAQPVEQLVGVIEVARVGHRGREAGGGPHRGDHVEIEADGADGRELDCPAPLPDGRLAELATEAAKRLSAGLGRNDVDRLLEPRGDGGGEPARA